MPKRKRTHNTRLIKSAYSYTIQEISELFGVHKNAVRNWLKAGLPKIDQQKPFFIHGSDLIEFLKSRQKSRKRKCKTNELYCFKCRMPRKAKNGSVEFILRTETKLNIRAICDKCKTPMNRAGSVKKRNEYERDFGRLKPVEKHIRAGMKNQHQGIEGCIH